MILSKTFLGNLTNRNSNVDKHINNYLKKNKITKEHLVSTSLSFIGTAFNNRTKQDEHLIAINIIIDVPDTWVEARRTNRNR